MAKSKPSSFTLNKGVADFFTPSSSPGDSYDNSNGSSGNNSICEIPIDSLLPYRSHPFKMYSGQRFIDMVESIRDNGVIIPIVVRPIEITDTPSRQSGEQNEQNVISDVIVKYEILSGHNRTAAAKEAGLSSVPALVRNDLTDEEALLIVTETNLIQRSFSDMSHSERAVTLATRHEAIKRQGKRVDLIKEIEDMVSGNGTVNDSNNGNMGKDTNISSDANGEEPVDSGNTANVNTDDSTCATVGHKLKSREKIAQEYNLGKNTIARYLRINKLIPELKDRLDSNEFSIRAAVDISYLYECEQSLLNAHTDITADSHGPYRYEESGGTTRGFRTVENIGERRKPTR